MRVSALHGHFDRERRVPDVEILDVQTKVARGATSLYVANVVATVFNTAYFVLLTNVLAPQEVGLVSLLNIIVIAIGTVAIVGSPMVGAGLSSPPAVARFLAQYTTSGGGRAARKIVLTHSFFAPRSLSASPPFSATLRWQGACPIRSVRVPSSSPPWTRSSFLSGRYPPSPSSGSGGQGRPGWCSGSPSW